MKQGGLGVEGGEGGEGRQRVGVMEGGEGDTESGGEGEAEKGRRRGG